MDYPGAGTRLASQVERRCAPRGRTMIAFGLLDQGTTLYQYTGKTKILVKTSHVERGPAIPICLMEIGVGLGYQMRHNFGVFVTTRTKKWRLALVVNDIHCSTVFQEKYGGFEVSLYGRQGERSFAIRVKTVHVGSMYQQVAHKPCVSDGLV